MVAYLGYTLRMRTLFRGWPIMVNDTHTRRRRSIRRHHWSSASILHASVFDIAQQSKPYRNIGKMHVLYSFNFVEVASRDLQIWFSKLCMAARVMALWRMMSQELPVVQPRLTNSSATMTSWPWTLMVNGISFLQPKACTFIFCQFTSNPRDAASLAIVCNMGTKSSSSSARRETSSAKSRSVKELSQNATPIEQDSAVLSSD